jgi:hypothetical protein
MPPSAQIVPESPSPVTSKSVKVAEAPTITTHEVQDDSSVSKISRTHTNGSTRTTSTTTSQESSFGYFGRVKDVFRSVTSMIGRVDDYNETQIKQIDLRAYLDFISDERLIHMPKRGSNWDRVLSNAQFFGYQVWLFGKKIESYVPGGRDSAAAALASCQILLEVCLVYTIT